jgi:hypothetical protein
LLLLLLLSRIGDTHLVRGVAGQHDAAGVPVREHALLEVDELAAQPPRPQLAEEHAGVDGQVGHARGLALDVGGRVAREGRPVVGPVELAEDEEEGAVGLRHDAARVSPRKGRGKRERGPTES